MKRESLKSFSAAIVIGITYTAPLAAQQSVAEISAQPRIATAMRATEEPRLDGVLDDIAWTTADPISGFVQRDPDEGQPGSEETTAMIVYTDNALYVAIRAYDSDPDAIEAQLTRRDEWSPSDWVAVQIDSYYDRRTAYQFAVNPAGVKVDNYLFDDNSMDDTWNANWDVATRVDSEGWVAEFRIPWSQLRFARADENRFGLNFFRDISRRNERQYWRLRPRNASGRVSLFGDLVGLQGITPPRRVEFLPYTVATAARTPGEAGNPFNDGRDQSLDFGGDLNMGVTSALSLSATFNPDFGQVEADPAQVNLSAFENQFEDRRPFFNEGVDIFEFSPAGAQLFYSRRIGRRPSGSPDPRGGYAESIRNTTIYGAGKLTGKTPSGWTVGALSAVTAAEYADVLSGTGDNFADLVEPQSTFFVGRLARDLRGGQTQVGTFGTYLHRGSLGDLTFLRSSAVSGGFDVSHRFADDAYSFNASIAGSRINGSPEAIEAAQRSSARYFQRPDNDYRDVDPTRTSLTGFAGDFNFGKQAGEYRFRIGYNTISPDYEINDVGFQRNADFHNPWIWLSKRWLEPGRVFRYFQINLNGWTNYNYGGDRTNSGGNFNANYTLANYWNGWLGFNYNFGGLATDALRGGPLFERPDNYNVNFGINTDSRQALQVGINGFGFNQYEADTYGFGFGVNVNWRPAANLQFSASPNINRNIDTWQFVTSQDVAGEREYIFGELHQTTTSMTFRSNVTFTPELTLQVYAQPFIASGDYIGFSRVDDPRGATFWDRLDQINDDRLIQDGDNSSLDLDRDGAEDIQLGNPDFTFMSFNSNVVLRWEYNLGSTLFVVWQHGRNGFNNNGSYDLGESLDNLFSGPASNRFLVKLNYWLSL